MSNTIEESASSAYKQKIWGKDEGKEFITDGYTFKGKKSFGPAVEGLKEKMKKGVQDEIGNIKFKVLDNRQKGSGIEIDVEVNEGSERGIAILKLYGSKSKKNKNTVMVSKCKENDHKFVIKLAEKVIKPLMQRFLEEKEGTILTAQEEEKPAFSDEDKIFKCEVCEKVCISLAGLKGHKTKMHANYKKEKGIKTNKRKVCDEVIEVVEDLLREVIEISDEEVNLEESVNDNYKSDKRYSDKCGFCDFKVEATRKYTSLQMMLKHKEMCTFKSPKGTCPQCSLQMKDKNLMKRHMRDKHGHISISTSPPLKKKKKPENANTENDSDRDMHVEEEFDKIKDISLELEEMEIDDSDYEEEKKILLQRSNLNDKKVKVREKRVEEEEKKIRDRKSELESKKRMEKERDILKVVKETKKKKQKVKDSKKKARKLNKFKKTNDESAMENGDGCSIPNIQNIPNNCKHLVNENDVLYVVPGDGCCGPNCGSAFLFEDEVFGPKLRKRMNVFFAEHWYDNYQYKTQCSTDHPFIRKLKGNEVSFEDPEKLIDYLKTSEEAAYLWTDSEDLAVLSDMYQMHIKIITTKGIMDTNPTVNWIYPNKDLEEFAELKDVQLDTMVLLHENDIHFNLVVSKYSNLATLGSLSYRFNIGPMEKKETPDEKEEINDVPSQVDDKVVEIENLKRALESSERSKMVIQRQYTKSMEEVRKKTEETERLKIEVKDLNEIIRLEKELKMKSSGSSVIMEDCTDDDDADDERDVEFILPKKEIKKKVQDPRLSLSKAKDKKEYNCMDCDFQGTSLLQLNKHVEIKHVTKQHTNESPIKCRICGELFSKKGNLMYHRKNKHVSSVAYCRNKSQGNCTYSDDICWWKHSERDEDIFECYSCNDKFENKSQLMHHRKKKHRNTLGDCIQYAQNNCRYEEANCWYKHENGDAHEDEESATEEAVNNEAENENPKSVFQEGPKNLKPPLLRKNRNLKNQN